MKTLGIVVGIVGALILVLWLTVIDFWTVPTDDPVLSASIAPTLLAGDVVVVAKESVPDVPDLVRCVEPGAPDRFVVARMFAKNGDPINIQKDVANSRNRREPSPHTCQVPELEVAGKDGAKRILECREENYAGSSFEILRDTNNPGSDFAGTTEGGAAFLVSDNRPMHLDSRDYGPIEPNKCRRIYLRLWGAGGPLDMHPKWL